MHDFRFRTERHERKDGGFEVRLFLDREFTARIEVAGDGTMHFTGHGGGEAMTAEYATFYAKTLRIAALEAKAIKLRRGKVLGIAA